MKVAAIVVSAITAIFVILTLIFDHKNENIKKTIAKGTASLCFVVSGAICLSLNVNTYSWLIMGALILGLVGDILLGYHSQNEKVQDALDAGGMLAFIGGHVLFIISYLMQAGNFNYALFALVFGLPIVVLILFKLKLLTSDKKIMIVGALLYSVVIALTLASAIDLYLFVPTKASKMILAGTVLFASSDLTLAFLNYNKTVNRAVVFPFVLVLYYTGQNLIALSLML